MIADPECPVCGDRCWEIVGERTYRSDASAHWRPSARRVLFDIWLKGETRFHARFAACRTCGMMIYLPRPSVADMEAKFARNATVGDFLPSKDEHVRRTRQRARRLFGIVAPRLPRPVGQCRVLDFGGGDGRLLADFLAAGATCEVIDYCIHTVPGVRHAGRTEQDLARQEPYDAIICNHVVEHLAEPLPVLRQLARALKPDGLIYVEVPVEVRKAMPAGREPVTHVNFFIPESLKSLMQRAGYSVASCELTAYPHPNGSWSLCAGAIASPGESEPVEQGGFQALQRYLKPSLAHLARVNAMLWRSFPRRVVNKLALQLRAQP